MQPNLLVQIALTIMTYAVLAVFRAIYRARQTTPSGTPPSPGGGIPEPMSQYYAASGRSALGALTKRGPKF